MLLVKVTCVILSKSLFLVVCCSVFVVDSVIRMGQTRCQADDSVVGIFCKFLKLHWWTDASECKTALPVFSVLSKIAFWQHQPEVELCPCGLAGKDSPLPVFTGAGVEVVICSDKVVETLALNGTAVVMETCDNEWRTVFPKHPSKRIWILITFWKRPNNLSHGFEGNMPWHLSILSPKHIHDASCCLWLPSQKKKKPWLNVPYGDFGTRQGDEDNSLALQYGGPSTRTHPLGHVHPNPQTFPKWFRQMSPCMFPLWNRVSPGEVKPAGQPPLLQSTLSEMMLTTA